LIISFISIKNAGNEHQGAASACESAREAMKRESALATSQRRAEEAEAHISQGTSHSLFYRDAVKAASMRST